jgi:diaminohydroxyphosphoribosylaminopyrimidine deaminase/5-amino-6-(5-phosphoribosylamino)uracil reductase
MAEFTPTDREHMARALALAERGLYSTTPNPRVGCVIVKDGLVIGEGYHVRAGEPHAEVIALTDAHARGADPRGATMYVTLEPCNRHGRTPPCVDAVVGAGIARVVVAMRDPNPDQANGGDRLRAAGIDVAFGLLGAEAQELNVGFVSRMTRGRPWVRAKLAASLDGRTALANGESQWITGEKRAPTVTLAGRACAILTGVGTVIQDDPQLTVRASNAAAALRSSSTAMARHPLGAGTGGQQCAIVTAGERNAAWPESLAVLTLPDANGR